MATITGNVCGEPVGQCKCQAFSETPLPKQTKPESIFTDAAIREGKPPHTPIPSIQAGAPANSHLPSDKETWSIIKCGFMGMIAGVIGWATYISIAAELEGLIFSREFIILVHGLCCGAPVGLFAGIVIGGLILAKKWEDKSTLS
jgi:hypothetical protein